MAALVLVLNAGSSSLKFCVYEVADGAAGTDGLLVRSRGQIEGIGTAARFTAKDEGGSTINDRRLDTVGDMSSALGALGAWQRERYRGASVLGVGHRVVHGGAQHAAPTIVTAPIRAELGTLVPLAPLHQPYNLAAIDAVSDRLPGVPQVACFDTGFHRGQSAVVSMVPLPLDVRRGGVQRYGFHGLSYEYIASRLPQVAPGIAAGRVVVAHLGSGASLCAMKGGRSVDSTFGFTALDGLCMGTRPGALDPGVVLYLFQALGLSPKEVETMLYKKSGLLGISGISNDMRDLIDSKDPAARLAVDYFVYRAAREIGALAASLHGLDALVFTAGIGENSAAVRKRICDASAWLGIDLDQDANTKNRPRISSSSSRVSAWVIPTNEELMIARHTTSVLGLAAAGAGRTHTNRNPT